MNIKAYFYTLITFSVIYINNSLENVSEVTVKAPLDLQVFLTLMFFLASMVPLFQSNKH